MKSFHEWIRCRLDEALVGKGGVGITPGWRLQRPEEEGTEQGASFQRHIKYFNAKHDKTLSKIEQVLNRSRKFNFHVYFGTLDELEQMFTYKQPGFFNSDVRQQFRQKENRRLWLQQYFFGNTHQSGLRQKKDYYGKEDEVIKKPSHKTYMGKELGVFPNDIVYVKTSHGGDVWTPWIVMHGLGHAINDFTQGHFDQQMREIIDDYFKRVKIFHGYSDDQWDDFSSKGYGVDHGNILNPQISYDSFYRPPEDQLKLDWPSQSISRKTNISLRKEVWAKIFKFRSASHYGKNPGTGGGDPLANSISMEEHYFETLAWYLYSGCRIPLPSASDYQEIYDTINRLFYNSDQETIQEIIRNFKQNTDNLLKSIESLFDLMLKFCQGKVVTDVR
jgi:hypothetical protein